MSLNGALSGVGNGSTSTSANVTLPASNAVGQINFTGISSGLDTNSIIQELLQADKIPITQLQNQQATLNNTLAVLQQYATNLQAFGSAANALNSAAAFNPIKATTGDDSVATVTATAQAIPGTYSIVTTKLAQAEKISSAAQTDATTGLNLSGTVVINGHGVQISGSDSLTSIAQKINALNIGVTAGIINGGTGSAYLTLAANSTGAASAIQIADMQGTVAGSLGLITGSAAVRNSSGGAALGYALGSQTTNISTLLNGNNMGTQTFSINGVQVSVDPTSTNLEGLVGAINTANTGATASIVTANDQNGNPTYQLKISGMTSFTDTTGLLSGLGVVQQGYGKEVVQAQDAAFSVDGVNLTSASNSVSNVIQGATFQLLKGTPSNPASTTLTLARDTSAISSSVQNFVTAYNNLAGYVAQNSQLDPSTFATGPLFGNSTVQQVQNQLASNMFAPVSGINPPYNNLAAIGLGFDQNGNLTFDQTKLQTALEQDPTDVANLFQATGSGSTGSLSYVSSSNSTVPSNSSPYAVNITQAATEGVYTASTAQTQPLAQSELLTFGGSLFGHTNQTILLSQGDSINDVVNAINSNAALMNEVTASVQNGALTITSKRYGSNGNFTVSSDTAASASSTGIQGGSYVSGLDVAGTINGEAATGNGQFLTGNTGNATTAGLQISYTGTSTGNVGTVSFQMGVGALLNSAISSFTDPTNGLITSAENTITTQVNDYGTQITQLQTAMSADQAQLQAQFANMETALAQLQAQQKQLSSVLGTATTAGH